MSDEEESREAPGLARTVRPIELEEIELARRVRRPLLFFDVFIPAVNALVFAFTFGCLGSFAAALARVAPLDVFRVAATAALVGLLLALYWDRGSLERVAKRVDPRVEEDLARGTVAVLEVAPLGAARARPDRGRHEPPAFVLDLGGGRLLFLVGDYLRGAPAFPSARLEIVRLETAKRTLRVVASGEPVALLAEGDAASPEEFESSELEQLEDGERFAGSLRTWRRDLRWHLRASA